MSSLTLILVLAILPIPVIYLFYHRYFTVKPSHLYHLEYFAYGVILAMLILLLSPYLLQLLAFTDTAAPGFLNAALIEKTGAYIFIGILMFRFPPMLMVLNMVISAMLLGLGFATVENVMYVLAVRDPVVLVRVFSSVPLHVLTCGLIGYGLALARFNRKPLNKVRYVLAAFIIPLIFHGLYDTLLIIGGASTYWTAPLLVMLIAGMEYILAKSQTLPLLDGLRKHGISIEEWTTIQREPQYERWILRSMGSKNREYVPFFRLRPGRVRAVVIIILLAVAAAALLGQPFIMKAINYRLRVQEAFMLFTLLPALYSLNLCAVGVVNPKYFQNSLIKIPIIIDVDLSVPGAVIKTTTYHVTGDNCYLKTVDPIGRGTDLTLVFTCADFSSRPVPGVVVWDSHDQQKQLSGTLVRFTGSPWGYRLFLLRYYLYRVALGLFFNLRLPGFKSIRRLFVRPVSVMQKEWRFDSGQTLFDQGEEGRVFYLIRKGEVDIIKTLETGERVRMTTLGEGDIFGEMAIVGNQPRLATAVCRTDCLLAVAEADNLDVLIENNPVFTQRLIKNFANRLHASEQIMLKSIADMDCSSKQREESFMKLLKLLAATATYKNSIVTRTGADIDAISSRLGIEKKIVSDIISKLTELPNDAPLESILNGFLKKL